MKKLFVFTFLFIVTSAFSQGRKINKPTLEATYSYIEINKALRDLVDANPKESYFADQFFNDFLIKVLLDKQFSNKEKVQIFYLMQKKLGYSFVGVNYLPPAQNYYIFHQSKIVTLQKTKDALKSLNLDPKIFIELADAHKTSDPIISSNSILLATLINTDVVRKKLQEYSKAEIILKSKSPSIFNHYVCLSTSLIQDSIIVGNLRSNLKVFTQENLIEDVLCAYYSRPNLLSPVKFYILGEKNEENDLSIQTALCALRDRVSQKTFELSIQDMITSATEPWKKELLNKLLAKKVPFYYSLTSAQIVIAKVWENVQISIFTDGTLISNNTLMEFDPN